MLPMQIAQAINDNAHNINPIILSTKPAVATPDGDSFLAFTPNTNPMIAKIIPMIEYVPKKINTKETIPSTKDVTAFPLELLFISSPPYYILIKS